MSVSAESKVVGVAGVIGVGRFGKTGQAAIGAVKTQVGERWRRRTALRQVTSRIPLSQAAKTLWSDLENRIAPPDAARSLGGTKAAKQIRNVLWISSRAQGGLHSQARHGWKEILDIHAQDDMLANVRRGKGLDGSRRNKPMRGWMGRDAIEDLHKDLPLDLFEVLFRRLYQSNAAQPNAARLLAEDAVVVVLKLHVLRLACKAFEIGKPL